MHTGEALSDSRHQRVSTTHTCTSAGTQEPKQGISHARAFDPTKIVLTSLSRHTESRAVDL